MLLQLCGLALVSMIALPAAAEPSPSTALAAEPLPSLVRRVAVFPIANISGDRADEAWWQMRELLTKDQRFFVASRRFMINRGVFQARTGMKASDSIILGKILDAQALVATTVIDRRFRLEVIEGETGVPLWRSEIDFHPAVPIADQIVKVAQSQMSAFIAGVPYQGFTVVDSKRGRALFENQGKSYAWVFVGLNPSVEVGDEVHWLEIRQGSVGGIPRYQDPTGLSVVAEGKITEIELDRALVEVRRVNSPNIIAEEAVVRFPRIASSFSLDGSTRLREAELGPEYLSREMQPIENLERKHNQTSTALAFIFNFAALVLLAF